MRKQPLFMLLIAGSLLMSAECQKENNQPATTDEFSEFIFGTAYGFCAGNCVHLFKMIGGQIYADVMDKGDPAEANFSATPLSDAKYQLALPLIETFPEGLFDEQETIGCPDCADQGAYFVQIKKDGKTYKWRIDTAEGSLPEYLKPYARKMGEIVQGLRE